jgi:hypothetical protein
VLWVHIGRGDASDQRRALGTPEAGAGSMTDIPRKPFGGKGTMDGYRCELCGAWVEYRNSSKLLAHDGPLPHVDQDRPAVRRSHRPRPQKAAAGLRKSATASNVRQEARPATNVAMSSKEWLGRQSRRPHFGSVPAFRIWETAVTSCAGANGLARSMLLGIPCEPHWSAPAQVV